jgi:hypothetical protein
MMRGDGVGRTLNTKGRTKRQQLQMRAVTVNYKVSTGTANTTPCRSDSTVTVTVASRGVSSSRASGSLYMAQCRRRLRTKREMIVLYSIADEEAKSNFEMQVVGDAMAVKQVSAPILIRTFTLNFSPFHGFLPCCKWQGGKAAT